MVNTAQIRLKTADEVAQMRAAGQIVAETLQTLREAVRPGISTGELDRLAYDSITSRSAKPSFLGYYGFPASICTSVNQNVVHGIPHDDEVLAHGDVISIDCGAILDGWHGDSAITVFVGEVTPEVQKLTQVCEAAMWAGIEQMRPGHRLGDISHAIEETIRGAGKYGVVRNYGGHGIGTEMHEDPYIPNHGKPHRGLLLQEGMVFAIEPMVTLGRPTVRELSDEWTVATKDGKPAVHTEHSVAITADGPWVLTQL